MANILCVYYSRTGHTEKLMREIAEELGCEIVKLEDGVKRGGFGGWLLSGLQAVARKVPQVKQPETALRLKEYDLVIIGSPVWAGRCSAPVRSFLLQYGEELKKVAYMITRKSNVRYVEVFEQMDLYVRTPRVAAVTIQPDTIGSDFWKNELLNAVRSVSGEESGDAL